MNKKLLFFMTIVIFSVFSAWSVPFNEKLTDEEKSLLREVFNTLGQFSGLNNFDWMEDLQAKEIIFPLIFSSQVYPSPVLYL